MTDLPFRCVLVANRGEIAVRILRTVRALGLRGALVHHALDADTLAVRSADLAVPIEGPSPVAAYLDGEQIAARSGEGSEVELHAFSPRWPRRRH